MNLRYTAIGRWESCPWGCPFTSHGSQEIERSAPDYALRKRNIEEYRMEEGGRKEGDEKVKRKGEEKRRPESHADRPND